MNPVRVGVIGVGSLGQHHARVYTELPRATLIAVADVDGARAESIASRHGCRAVTDFRELFGAVDAVSVVTPTLRHHDIARECLAAGLHVLVEKPLAASVEEARDLASAAASRGVTLQVGHIERFNSAFRAAQGAVKLPSLIECRRWAPFTPRGADVDVVLDLMIHDLDLVLGHVEAPVREIRAQGLAVLSPTTDVAQARIVFENGCVAAFSVNRVAESKVREVRMYGPDGFVKIDLAQQTAVHGRRTMGASGRYEMVTEEIRGDGREPLKLELDAFVDSVRTGARPAVSGQEGAAALELAAAIMADIARQGRKESDGPTRSHYRG